MGNVGDGVYTDGVDAFMHASVDDEIVSRGSSGKGMMVIESLDSKPYDEVKIQEPSSLGVGQVLTSEGNRVKETNRLSNPSDIREDNAVGDRKRRISVDPRRVTRRCWIGST